MNKDAYEISTDIKDLDLKHGICTDLGFDEMQLGNIDEAEIYHIEALGIAEKLNDKEKMSESRINLGNVYKQLGQYSRAIGLYEQALQDVDKTDNKRLLSVCYTQLGIACRLYGNFGKALRYHEEALSLSREIGDEQGVGGGYINLGTTYDGMNDYDIAYCYQSRALEVAQRLKDPYMESGCYINLGIAYRLNESYPQARYSTNESLKIAKRIRDLEGEALCYKNLGLIESILYTRNGDEDSLKEALSNLTECVRIGEYIGSNLDLDIQKIDYFGSIYDVYDVIIKLYLECSDKINAFDFLQRSKAKAFNELMASSIQVTNQVTEKELDTRLQTLLDQEQELLKKRTAAQFGQIFSSEDTQLSNTRLVEIRNTSEQLAKLHEEIAKINPNYVNMRSTFILPFNEILNLL